MKGGLRGRSPSNTKSSLTPNTTGASSEQDEDSSGGASEEEALAEIHSKISRTKEQIKKEQKNRDDNVDEYLKLSSNTTDKATQSRIKQVFEKKNAKSATNIAQYQKKLDNYLKRLQAHKESNANLHGGSGGNEKPPVVLKGLKNVRDGTKSILGKPKELLAQTLLRHKFGSADNLSSLSKDDSAVVCSPPMEDIHSKVAPRGSGSLPRDRGPSLLSAPTHGGGGSFDACRKCISEDGRRSEFSESLDSNHPSSGGVVHTTSSTLGGRVSPPGSSSKESRSSAEWKAVIQELSLHKEEVERLREDMEEMRAHFKQVVDSINYQLREERDRYERLEEQMNDLTELHQHEIENIKSGVADMEEKVQYQSDERLREISEHLQSLETKITSLEHQQTQQQYLNIEGLDSTNARAIMMKLITAALTILHVILFVIGIVMNIAKPFFQTTLRAVLTGLFILALALVHHQWQDLEGYYARLKSWRAA